MLCPPSTHGTWQEAIAVKKRRELLTHQTVDRHLTVITVTVVAAAVAAAAETGQSSSITHLFPQRLHLPVPCSSALSQLVLKGSDLGLQGSDLQCTSMVCV